MTGKLNSHQILTQLEGNKGDRHGYEMNWWLAVRKRRLLYELGKLVKRGEPRKQREKIRNAEKIRKIVSSNYIPLSLILLHFVPLSIVHRRK